MHIGFDAKRAFNNKRGLGNYSRNLIEGMVRYYPDNEYTLYGKQTDIELFPTWMNIVKDNIKIKQPVHSNKISQIYWRSYGVNRNIREDHPDIYHGLSHEIPGGKKIGNTKYIVTVHDLLIYRIKELFNPIDRNIYASKIKYSCKKADLILSVSQQTKDDLINYLNIPEEKIVVAYQSCHTIYYKKTDDVFKQSVKEKYHLPDEYLLYVGALIKHKNVKLIVQSLSILPSDMKIPLVIVGAGKNYKKELMQEIISLKLTDRVIFLNYVQDCDMPAVYQSAKIFVWPSFFEGFGIPLLEAMYSHVPVITTKGGCFSEVGGDAACYVNPKSKDELAGAIENILTDDQLYKDMQRKGDKQAIKFHLKNTTEKMNQIYSLFI